MRTLLIGWGDTVKVCQIKLKVPRPLNPEVPNKYVEISKLREIFRFHNLTQICVKLDFE